MNIKLSHSAVSLYQQCSFCYYLKYIEGIRPVSIKSALLFGKTLDDSFNILLQCHKDGFKERGLSQAKGHFIDAWTALKDTKIQYRKAEADPELVHYWNATIQDKMEWNTLYYKGLLFIESYYHDVLPKIKEVITIQEPFKIFNAEGDEINGIIDLIVRWEDGKVYLLDNKTSSFAYSKDDARNSPQLSLYHYVVSDKYKIDGIGFIVMDKNINKNKVKKCKGCGVINKGRHDTCPELVNGKRCGLNFEITIKPSVDLEFIFDKIDTEVQNKIIDIFDEANNGISNGVFATQHNPKFGKFGPCDFYKYYEGNPDFYKKEKKK